MTNDWIVLAVVFPLLAGVATTFLRGKLFVQRAVGLLTLLCTLATVTALTTQIGNGSGVLVSRMGDWVAPFGIAIVFDGLSATLLLVASVVAVAVYLAAFSLLDERLERGWFHPLFHLLILGVNFSFLTGDLFNLFVAFEIMLMASYGLMCLGGRQRQLSQAFKYVILNLVGSTVFVLTAGMVYGMVGTLNYADLARIVAQASAAGEPLPAGFQTLAVCLLFVFCLKAAVFPLWFWLPDTYHTMPAPVGAIFAALLSKVGVYAILRLFPAAFASPSLGDSQVIGFLLPLLAGSTMIIAILAACAATDIRRLIAMILISHVGYLVFAVSMMRPEAFSGALHYMAQEMLVIAGLFVAAGVIEHRTGTADLNKLAGMHRVFPGLAGLFFILSMSLVGTPPLSGFWGKAVIIREGLAADAPLLTAATVLTAALTLVAVGRMWARLFWGPAEGPGVGVPRGAEPGAGPILWTANAGIATLAIAALSVGLAAEPTFQWTSNATAQLHNPVDYRDAVLPTPQPRRTHQPTPVASITPTHTPEETVR